MDDKQFETMIWHLKQHTNQTKLLRGDMTRLIASLSEVDESIKTFYRQQHEHTKYLPMLKEVVKQLAVLSTLEYQTKILEELHMSVDESQKKSYQDKQKLQTMLSDMLTSAGLPDVTEIFKGQTPTIDMEKIITQLTKKHPQLKKKLERKMEEMRK